jgi:hypothetical protein
MTARRAPSTATAVRLATVAALLAGAVGCSSTPSDPLVGADCDPVQRPQLQEGSHLIGDREPPVPYSSSPPTSGWHSGGPPLDPGTYLEEVSGPEQVRVIEQGGVVVAHDPALPADQLERLQRMPSEVEGIVVTPYADAPAPVTLTAWGVLQHCRDVAPEEVAAFRDAHASEPAH